MDLEQLAFIERWRRNALRGVIVALDGRRGDLVVTMRVGDLGERLDLRGRDASGALRKARLTIGDRVTLAIEYVAQDVEPGNGAGVSDGEVRPGSTVEGTVTATGSATIVDVGGFELIVRGDSLTADVGAVVRFRIADEGTAYYIPTR